MDDILKERLEFLSRVPIFRNIKEKHLKSIALSGEEMEYEAGKVIVKEGESGVGFYLILDGRAEVKKRGEKLAELCKGDYFGEIALLDGGPRTADVIAAEHTKALLIMRWDFLAFIKENSEVAVALLEAVCERLRRQAELTD